MFQSSVLRSYLERQEQQLSAKKLSALYLKFQSYFGNEAIQSNYKNSKETSLQGEFLSDLFRDILGYTPNPRPNFNLRREEKNETDAKEADGVIIVDGEVRAVIELKSPKTTDLDKIDNQAFGYHRSHSHSRYIITSNYQKLRFFIDKATHKIEFDLFNLSFDEFKKLYLCLSWKSIKSGLPQKMKDESVNTEDAITKELYAVYSAFKTELWHDLCEKNRRRDKHLLFNKTQKLLDRILFMLFAEKRGLLPPNTITTIIDDWKFLKRKNAYQSLYSRFTQHFGYLNTGRRDKENSDEDVFAYNGGLFKPDEVLDRVLISDDVLERHVSLLATYDFASEVDVNILGHIFESSLNAESRKKDGVFYTPKYVTTYIVEQTLGKLCKAKREELGIDAILSEPPSKKSETKKEVVERLNVYREWLLEIKVCDPACGSGAFLNQALEFFVREHAEVNELHNRINRDKLPLAGFETEVLENNIYGVDINEDSVEIAKLSLWLRSARSRRKLNDLSNRIKLGNSLISDATIAGDKAFDWQKEFPEIFANGGFDVVIGNPPYGADIDNFIAAFEQLYPETSQGFKDIYKYFFNRAINLINTGGVLGFITPNTFFRQPRYADLRRFLLKFAIHQLVDLGENVFDETVPTAITILSNAKQDKTLFADLSKSTAIETDIAKFSFTAIDQNLFDKTPNNIFVGIFREKRENEFLLDDILEMKDAGINYQRVNVGLGDKGNSDLGQRLFYEGVSRDKNDREYWKGTDVDRYFIAKVTSRFVRTNVPLAANERVILNSDYFQIAPKIIWRQTAQFPICVIDNVGVWFGRSIQAGIIKEEFRDRISYLYLCCLLNSKYLCQLYENNVKETGRVFPQVKLEKIKPLPIIIADNQQPFIERADKMIALTSDLQERRRKFLKRVTDNFAGVKINRVLDGFADLDFAAFVTEMKKQKQSVSLKSQDEWDAYFTTVATDCRTLSATITQTDAEIDRLVYELYGLTEEEIGIVENKMV